MIIPAVPVKTINEATRTALGDEIREYLSGHLYVCGRVEEAWSYGTMSLDDFSPAADNEDVVQSLVEIALEKLGFAVEVEPAKV